MRIQIPTLNNLPDSFMTRDVREHRRLPAYTVHIRMTYSRIFKFNQNLPLSWHWDGTSSAYLELGYRGCTSWWEDSGNLSLGNMHIRGCMTMLFPNKQSIEKKL